MAKKPAQAAPVGPVDERLAAAITGVLQPGGGRSHIVGSYKELVERLNADGIEFVPRDLYVTWAALLKSGIVARRPGVGYWLSNGFETLWQTAPTDLSEIDGPSWG